MMDVAEKTALQLACNIMSARFDHPEFLAGHLIGSGYRSVWLVGKRIYISETDDYADPAGETLVFGPYLNPALEEM